MAYAYLELADFLLIAQAVLGVPAEAMVRLAAGQLSEAQFTEWMRRHLVAPEA